MYGCDTIWKAARPYCFAVNGLNKGRRGKTYIDKKRIKIANCAALSCSRCFCFFHYFVCFFVFVSLFCCSTKCKRRRNRAKISIFACAQKNRLHLILLLLLVLWLYVCEECTHVYSIKHLIYSKILDSRSPCLLRTSILFPLLIKRNHQ